MRETVLNLLRKGGDLAGARYLTGAGARRIRQYLPRVGLAVLKPAWDNVLVLAPHPDDEVFGAGLLLSLLHEQGKRVTIAYATDGSAYSTGAGGSRRGEAQASAERLGAEAIFLGLEDGNLENSSGLAAAVAELALQVHPQAIIAPWFGDYHPDHRALARAALSRPYPGAQYLFYATFSPLWPGEDAEVAYITRSEEQIRLGLEGYRASVNRETTDAFLVLRRTMALAVLNENCFWEPFLAVPGGELPQLAEAAAQQPPIYPTLKKARHWRSFIRDVVRLGKAAAREYTK